MKDELKERLWQAASAARERAYAPYSRFSVGAALITRSGAIYAGCNVENASYGLTICAERNAVFQMVAAGEDQIAAILIAGPTEEFLVPCGACRQVIAEFAEQAPVLLANRHGRALHHMEALLPHAFTGRDFLPRP